MPETIKLNATQSFIMKITSKRKLQQIESSYSSDIDSKNSIIIYKNFTKEQYSLLMNYRLYHQIISYNLERSYYKMSISEKIKAINNKIKRNKSQNNLDRQDTKISALSSGNVSKYKFLFTTMFYHKKLRQSRNLNIYYYVKN